MLLTVVTIAVALVGGVISTPADSTPPCSSELGVDYSGNDLWGPFAVEPNAKECELRCRRHAECNVYMFNQPTGNCYIKTTDQNRNEDNDGNIAGICKCNRYKVPEKSLIPPSTCSSEVGVDFDGNDIWSNFHKANSARECQKRCWEHSGCQAYTFHAPSKNCYLKTLAMNRRETNRNNTAGICNKTPVPDCIVELGVNYPANNLGTPTQEPTPKDCILKCQNSATCKGFTYNIVSKQCSLKSAITPTGENNPNIVSAKCKLTKPFYMPRPCRCSMEIGSDYPGNDVATVQAKDPRDCREKCLGRNDCVSFTFNLLDKRCYLKNAVNRNNRDSRNPQNISGICN